MIRSASYDGESAESLRQRLGVPVELFATVASTQDVAHDLAQQGADAGTVVLADTQQAGRGRLGRAWASVGGGGVWCTIIERVRDQRALEVLSLRVGLALAERLDRVAGERVRLKWPNDLFVRAGKFGGILAEARWTGPDVGWIAIGIGVNVVPPGVQGGAALPAGTRRLDVLAAVVSGTREAAAARGPLTPSELNRYRERDILIGREIVSPASGTARGIDGSGALLVDTPMGTQSVRTGTVQLREELA